MQIACKVRCHPIPWLIVDAQYAPSVRRLQDLTKVKDRMWVNMNNLFP